MTALTIQDMSRRSGLSEPTLRYYEGVGLVGPIARDASSGHRRYRDEDLDTLQALACCAPWCRDRGHAHLPGQRVRGQEAAGEQRDLLLRHAERIEAEIETLRTHLDYLRAKGRCGTPATEVMRRGDRGESAVAGHDSAPRRGGAAMSPVLVTGGPAYVGTQLTAALLRDGRRVRATVRSSSARPRCVRRCDAVMRTTAPWRSSPRLDRRRGLDRSGGGLRRGPSRRLADDPAEGSGRADPARS